MIRELSKKKLEAISKKTKEEYEKLCNGQENTLQNPTVQNTEQEARWSKLSDLEEKFLSQKAKLHWLKIGDGNNKQFHQAVKIREVRNAIREIQRSDGTTVDTQELLSRVYDYEAN